MKQFLVQMMSMKICAVIVGGVALAINHDKMLQILELLLKVILVILSWQMMKMLMKIAVFTMLGG